MDREMGPKTLEVGRKQRYAASSEQKMELDEGWEGYSLTEKEMGKGRQNL